MFDRLNKLFFGGKKPSSRVMKAIDEIVGVWENGADDGSGLHAFWGWAFEFREEGIGTVHNWDHQKNTQSPFLWGRVGEKAIQIKWADYDNEWAKIEYTIVDFVGAYKVNYLKLTDNNYVPDEFYKEGFWNYSDALYKQKNSTYG